MLRFPALSSRSGYRRAGTLRASPRSDGSLAPQSRSRAFTPPAHLSAARCGPLDFRDDLSPRLRGLPRLLPMRVELDMTAGVGLGRAPCALKLWWRGVDSNHRRLKPTDLQSAPFDRSGTSPDLCRSWSWRWDSNPQPADYKSAALPIELRQQHPLSTRVATIFPGPYIVKAPAAL